MKTSYIDEVVISIPHLKNRLYFDIKGKFNEKISSRTFSVQMIEVAKQKWEDDDAADAIIAFLNNEHGNFLDEETSINALKEFLNDINLEYTATLAEEDTKQAIKGVENILDTCSRVVLITHSQGNFYGNAILNSIYSSYTFPNGYAIADYPMLATMQIASPVDIPGGLISTLYPEIVAHITNDNDKVMALVRNLFNAVEANYDAQKNSADNSGHGLEASYLSSEGQALEISKQMEKVAYSLTPYPMQAQRLSNSSAFTNFGYSEINQVLDIEFNNGSVYRYTDIYPVTFYDLLNATSKGNYFNSNIRNNHETTRIE